MGKNDFLRLLESSSAAAAITVVIGGLVGACLNGRIQESLQKRQHALVAYEERLQRDRGIAEELFALVGTALAAAENYMVLSTPAFCLSNFDENSADWTAMNEQRRQLVTAYNAADRRWRSNQHLLGLQVSYFQQDPDKVLRSWGRVVTSMNGFMSCAQDVGNKTEGAADCSTQREGVDIELGAFTQVLRENYGLSDVGRD